MTKNQTKELPILMNSFSVNAILELLKTHTRRAIKPSSSLFDGHPVTKTIKAAWNDFDWDNACVDPGPSPSGNPGPYLKVPYPKENTTHRIYPKYAVGDILWVRETFKHWYFGKDWVSAPGVMYKADGEMLWRTRANQVSDDKWRPSIFMPKWASRISLEIKDIRIERIQYIATGDIIKEGLQTKLREHAATSDLREQWIELWNSINLSRGYGWGSNPWVFVIVFKVMK